MTALVVGTNSYVTLAEAEDYVALRPDTDAWDALTPSAKEQMLVSAADYLDSIQWAGTAFDTTTPQAMAWPRVVDIWLPRLGSKVELDGSSVPQDVKDAQIELAVFIQANGSYGGGADKGGAAGGDPSLIGTPNDIKVGSIELTGLKSDGSQESGQTAMATGGLMVSGVSLPPVVYAMIKPYLTAYVDNAMTTGLYQPVWRAW